MRLEILINGGMIQIPGVVNAPYSTVSLLKGDGRVVLIDPGSFVVHQYLEERLSEMGIKLEDVTDIVLTHFHLDHAYNSKYFPNATVHIHGSYALKDYSKFGPIVGREYLEVLNSWRRVNVLEGGEVLFEKVKVIHTPWHAREHVSLLVETDNLGMVFFPGDICYTRLDYFEIVKGYRNDDVARFVLKMAGDSDLIVFTHDRPIEPIGR